MFSNESTIQPFAARKQKVCRPKGRRYNEKYTISTKKHLPSQMIWGAMSCSGSAVKYFLPPGTTMNGKKYLVVLKDRLKIHLDIHQCRIFKHDGAPCHRSKIVFDFLKNRKVEVLQ